MLIVGTKPQASRQKQVTVQQCNFGRLEVDHAKPSVVPQVILDTIGSVTGPFIVRYSQQTTEVSDDLGRVRD
jgi:hypothetical protein